MPRISRETKEEIANLSHAELLQIVLKMAAREKSVMDYVMVNYIDKEMGEEVLYEEAIADLNALMIKGYRGFSEQLQWANMLAACIKRINVFTRVSNNKRMEADLLVYLLEVPFSHTPDLFGTCFTRFDTKVAQILKRLITLVTKKLHADYRIEYEDKINNYLKVLHGTSNHLDMIYDMPQSI